MRIVSWLRFRNWFVFVCFLFVCWQVSYVGVYQVKSGHSFVYCFIIIIITIIIIIITIIGICVVVD